jgi:aspartate aminotransferase
VKIAGGIARLGTESAFEVLARAKALEASGRRVIHLEIGEPDFATPDHIVEAGVRALRAGHTHYCPAPGLPELREAAAAYLSRSRGIVVDPERVVVTPGAKPILFFGVLATCDPGDEVIYPDPGFPIYRSVIEWAGATPVALPLREDRGFALDPDDLADRLTDRTRLVILNFPGNPTGGVLDAATTARVAEVLDDHSCWVLADEVYSELRYDAEHVSIVGQRDLLERTIILDGWSKTFAMTGWRLGYAALPAALVEPVTRLVINSVSCTPPAVQLAGVAALNGPWQPVIEMRESFRRRRDVVVGGLNALPGIRCVEPQGAFYAFPNVAGTGLDAQDLADLLLTDHGVAVLPGGGFGAHGRNHLRISYAAAIDDLHAAIEEIGALVEPADPR